MGPLRVPRPATSIQKVPLLSFFCSAMMQDDCSEKHPSWVVPKCFWMALIVFGPIRPSTSVSTY